MIIWMTKRYKGRQVFADTIRSEQVVKDILNVLKDHYPGIDFISADLWFFVEENGKDERIKVMWVSDHVFQSRDGLKPT